MSFAATSAVATAPLAGPDRKSPLIAFPFVAHAHCDPPLPSRPDFTTTESESVVGAGATIGLGLGLGISMPTRVVHRSFSAPASSKSAVGLGIYVDFEESVSPLASPSLHEDMDELEMEMLEMRGLESLISRLVAEEAGDDDEEGELVSSSHSESASSPAPAPRQDVVWAEYAQSLSLRFPCSSYPITTTTTTNKAKERTISLSLSNMSDDALDVLVAADLLTRPHIPTLHHPTLTSPSSSPVSAKATVGLGIDIDIDFDVDFDRDDEEQQGWDADDEDDEDWEEEDDDVWNEEDWEHWEEESSASPSPSLSSPLSSTLPSNFMPELTQICVSGVGLGLGLDAISSQ